MLPTAAIETHFAGLDPELLAIVHELRGIVARVNPLAVEEIRRRGLVYYDARRGGPVKAGICQVLVFPGEVRLAFIHGAFLPDPGHLLVGRTMPKRYLPLRRLEQAPWPAILALVQASNRFDPLRHASGGGHPRPVG